jgi:hypothetical protein
MRFPTYLELKNKVLRNLDLQDEDFIEPEELIGFFNDAIDLVESEIHTLYEDYFLAEAPLALVTGTAEYDLPSDIYADKVRAIIYASGNLIYSIQRIAETNKFEAVALNDAYPTSNPRYQYYINNRSTVLGHKIRLVPASLETSASNVKIHYIRNANRIDDSNLTTADATVIDIPEFTEFVVQHVKVKCYEKEGHPNLEVAKKDLEACRAQMTSTLATRVPDNRNDIEMDKSHYEEMV